MLKMVVVVEVVTTVNYYCAAGTHQRKDGWGRILPGNHLASLFNKRKLYSMLLLQRGHLFCQSFACFPGKTQQVELQPH